MMNILIYDDNLKDIEHLLFCLNGLLSIPILEDHSLR